VAVEMEVHHLLEHKVQILFLEQLLLLVAEVVLLEKLIQMELLEVLVEAEDQ
jgi:hypothetical protein